VTKSEGSRPKDRVPLRKRRLKMNFRALKAGAVLI
jgi:hypothetical protein